MNSPVEKDADDVGLKLFKLKSGFHETEQFTSKTNKEEPKTTNFNSKEKEELVTYLRKVIKHASNRETTAALMRRMGIETSLINEAEKMLELQLAYEKISQFGKIDTELQELKAKVLRKCGKMSIEEKRKTLFDMKRLTSPADLSSASIIIAGNDDLYFDKTNNVFVLGSEQESEMVLWELKFFMKDKELADAAAAAADDDDTIDSLDNKDA